ncbi:n19m, NADH-ubiquinone oxidoreductase 9.5 kDa subunit [Coemansia sp. BCRC 34490]|nr:n19m, NADH-ubiquinone oxidoreductase 9.5 kDa subunit [Coemansia sp. RSA 1939]KAJ2744937.1 n19m, NADH-ubiquinone oxidoreductase 9.5 kDa subunit [Coemansia sp. BCRC 34490]
MVLNAIRNATFKNPFALWGLGLGFAGPLLVLVVPPIRDATGFVSPTDPPTGYPLPKRERRPTSGYED